MNFETFVAMRNMAKKDLAKLDDPNAWENHKKEFNLDFTNSPKDEKEIMNSFSIITGKIIKNLREAIEGRKEYKPVKYDQLHNKKVNLSIGNTTPFAMGNQPRPFQS